MKTQIFATILVVLVSSCTMAQRDPAIGGGCDGCQMMFDGMPTNLSWETKIASDDEPGDPMVITGRILKPDGKTPAPDIILYVYHTDNKGEYSASPGQKDAKRHGHLRGWVKTDAQGRYKITTIRPASYPQGRNPQHIHPIVDEPGKGYYYIDEFLFDDDPFLTSQERARQEGRGGSGIIKLTKEGGVWKGSRDIVLRKNIPGYQ
jgi:protocatechuate 3,4-dioxygenase beta subunit